jgi:hypothetical protein
MGVRKSYGKHKKTGRTEMMAALAREEAPKRAARIGKSRVRARRQRAG